MVEGGKMTSCISFREIASGGNLKTDGAVGVERSDKAFLRLIERKVQNLGGIAGIQGKVVKNSFQGCREDWEKHR